MNSDSDVLRQIEHLPVPRHLFVLPPWADAATLDRLMDQGYLTCAHHQRDKHGALNLVMHLQLTPKAAELREKKPTAWPRLAWKGSLAGASLTAMSLIVLYVA
jgi:hypothetical protein